MLQFNPFSADYKQIYTKTVEKQMHSGCNIFAGALLVPYNRLVQKAAFYVIKKPVDT